MPERKLSARVTFELAASRPSLETLPESPLHTPENDIISLYGQASWGALEYCLKAIELRAQILKDLARYILQNSKSRSSMKEATFLDQTILAGYHSTLKSLSEDKLPKTILAFEGLYIPPTTIGGLRDHLAWILREMASVKGALEQYTKGGMKRSFNLLRSTSIFPAGELERFDNGLKLHLGQFSMKLESHLALYKRISLSSRIEPIPGLSGIRAIDPGVALDSCFSDRAKDSFDIITPTSYSAKKPIPEIRRESAMFFNLDMSSG